MSELQILAKLRQDARSILDRLLEAADPGNAVRRAVKRERDLLRLPNDATVDLTAYDRVLVVGAGKASAPMGMVLEEILGDRISQGLICVKYGHSLPLRKIRVVEGGHPLPDAAGQAAAEAILEILRAAGPRDLVISCISGGGSALLPAPAAEVTLAQKEAITRDLLSVGADIHEINAVRKHLSLSKGGSLMKAAFPAFVVNLMLSDVIGDRVDSIASGPFTPDRSTFRDALRVLEHRGLLERVPAEIRERIVTGAQGKIPETPKEGDPIFANALNIIVGSNIIALKAGKEKARELGYETLILSSAIGGDTSQAALFHAALAEEVTKSGNPIPRPACLLSGGETTVVIKGHGLGGRCQEFALTLVPEASRLPSTVFLCAGSDGTDGPTDAAGAVVDSMTLERAESMGMNYRDYLANNDSHHFFRKLGDLIVTGPTRTNVMDLRIVLIG